MGEPHILLYGEQLGLGLPRADMFLDYHRWESEPVAILGFGSQVPELYEVRAARYESEARSGRQFCRSTIACAPQSTQFCSPRTYAAAATPVRPHA